jgi:hypothetical protein
MIVLKNHTTTFKYLIFIYNHNSKKSKINQIYFYEIVNSMSINSGKILVHWGV